LSNYILLSHIISSNTPSYGNRDSVEIRSKSSIENGETANTSTWIFSNNHIGTHIDVPKHFSNDGMKTFEISISDYFFNKVELVEIPCMEGRLINNEDFSKFDNIDLHVELILIRTGYEKFRKEEKYWNDNPGLAPELANYFRKKFKKLRCVGFDFISLTSWKFRKEGRLCHSEFLTSLKNCKPILIIEDMSLNNVSAKINSVIVSPLFVEDGNGGAVTIFADIT
jgi:kynurenine formamidase